MTWRGRVGFSLPLQNSEGRTHTSGQVPGVCISGFSTGFLTLSLPGPYLGQVKMYLERVISAWGVVVLYVVIKAMQQHTDCFLFPFLTWISIANVPIEHTSKDKCLGVFPVGFYSRFSIWSVNWEPDHATCLIQPLFSHSHLFCQNNGKSIMWGLEGMSYLGYSGYEALGFGVI